VGRVTPRIMENRLNSMDLQCFGRDVGGAGGTRIIENT
jgi:hypothetical protein